MITDNYLIDALQAQSEGVDFPIDFDVIWESYGFKQRKYAIQYIERNLETLIQKGLLQLKTVKYQSGEINKFFLSVKGYKFTLARAKTEEGATYLLHLLDIEETYLSQLQRTFDAPVQVPAVTRKRVAKLKKERTVTKLNKKVQELASMVVELKTGLEAEIIMNDWVHQQLRLDPNHEAQMLNFEYSIQDLIDILNPLPKSHWSLKVKYLHEIILQNGKEGEDWVRTGLGVQVNLRFVIGLALCYRGMVGADLSRIPYRFIIDRDWLFRENFGRINTRFPIG